VRRIDENTVQLTDEEQILGDFYAFLRTERGMTRQEAVKLLTMPESEVLGILTTELMDYEDDVQQLPGDSPGHYGVQMGDHNIQSNTFGAPGRVSGEADGDGPPYGKD
jgi:hypothetical protein